MIKKISLLGLSLPILLSATPTNPSQLELKALSNSAISITWQDNSNDETGFKIYRNDTLIMTTNADVHSYIDTGLDANTLYTYTVKATDDEEKINFNHNQHIIADKIISVFENSTTTLKYAYAEHLDDQHGITAGRAGFTSATGDLLMVVQRYVALKPDKNPLSPYIKELQRLDEIYAQHDYELSSEGANVDNLDGLIEAWQESAQDPLFKDVQDEIVDKLYFNPARDVAQSIGAKLPLTLLHIYDASIQHGPDGVRAMIDRVSVAKPKDCGDEITWLKEFNKVRLDVMLHTVIDGEKIWEDSIYRQHELVDMIKENNINLCPFIMTIEDWGDEEFEIAL